MSDDPLPLDGRPEASISCMRPSPIATESHRPGTPRSPAHECRASLILHQPDLDLPGLLLGVCTECRYWFLIAGPGGAIVPLPEVEEFRSFG